MNYSDVFCCCFLFFVFCSKASCLSFRCSALVCGPSRRVTFRVFSVKYQLKRSDWLKLLGNFYCWRGTFHFLNYYVKKMRLWSLFSLTFYAVFP